MTHDQSLLLQPLQFIFITFNFNALQWKNNNIFQRLTLNTRLNHIKNCDKTQKKSIYNSRLRSSLVKIIMMHSLLFFFLFAHGTQLSSKSLKILSLFSFLHFFFQWRKKKIFALEKGRFNAFQSRLLIVDDVFQYWINIMQTEFSVCCLLEIFFFALSLATCRKKIVERKNLL